MNMKLSRNLVVVAILACFAILLGGFAEVMWSKWSRHQSDNALTGSLSKTLTSREGFVVGQAGAWFSERPGSRLAYQIGDTYLDQLHVHIGGRVNVPFELIVFPATGGDALRLMRPWQARLSTTPYQFMNTAVYKIQTRVSRIEVIASDYDLAIIDLVANKRAKYQLERMGLFSGIAFLLLLGGSLLMRGIPGLPALTWLTAASAGILITWSSPLSFVSWDESIHYRRSDTMSLQSVVQQPVLDVFWRAHVVTSSFSAREQDQINAFFDTQPALEVAGEPSAVTGIDRFFHWYREIGYVPAAAGLFTGRLLDLPNHEVFRAGRVANLLVYAFLIACAVAVTPVGKLTMAVIGLLPTSIFLASHYSYDPWLIAWCMLGLAFFLRIASKRNPPASSFEKLLVLAAPFIAVGPKAIYCLVILLPLLLSSESLGSRREAFAFRSAVVLAFLFSLASFLLPFLLNGPGTGDSRGGAGVNSTAQVAYVLSNPMTYASDLLKFMKGYLDPIQLSGLSVDWANLGNIRGFGLLLILLLSAVLADALHAGAIHPTVLNARTRLFMIGISMVTVALVCSALYVSYTPVAHHTFNGVQKRYLTPLLAFLLIALIPMLKIVRAESVSPNRAGWPLIAVGLVTMYGTWTNLVSQWY